MSVGEMWYLALVVSAFAVFMLALAWVERTWRPRAAVAPLVQPKNVERRAA